MYSPLAVRAIMTAAASDDNPLDWSFAYQAGLALTAVNPVLELEEARIAIGVDVVADGRAAQRDGLVQYFSECGVQLR